MNSLNTQKVNDIINKYNQGLSLKEDVKIWYDNNIGVRKSNLPFILNEQELNEWEKCKLDVHYFAENYCKIQTGNGIVQIKLRDYQKDILDLFKNKHCILNSSRQMGKTVSTSISILHFTLFSDDKNVVIITNKGKTSEEVLSKIKGIYLQLPFFLQSGVSYWNISNILFENGCNIKTIKRKLPSDYNISDIDYLYMDEFSHIHTTILDYYWTIIKKLVSDNKCKIIITSTPNGNNLFHELVSKSELPHNDPNWNGFH